jgi:MFS family permease
LDVRIRKWPHSCELQCTHQVQGQFAVDTILYGYSTFLPTIINEIGDWSTAEVQALTVPCYALGAITYLAVAWLSDRYQQRGIAVVTFCVVTMVGYGILLGDVSSGVHYFGCFVVAMGTYDPDQYCWSSHYPGLYVSVGIPLAWLPTNQPRYGKRTTATGMQLTIGNCAGIMAPFVSSRSNSQRLR